MAVIKVWSGVGHCTGCPTNAALTFETEPDGFRFPKAILCPVCDGSIRLDASYVIREAEDAGKRESIYSTVAIVSAASRIS